MRAVIFCAGNSTRLKPLTNKIPKPMVKIGDKPILEHLINHLKKYNIFNIVINLHYLPEQFYNYFGTKLLYFYEPKLLGETNTLKRIYHWLGENFIALNGDTLTNIDINAMYKNHLKNNASMTAFIDRGIFAGTWIYNQSFFLKEKTITRKINFFEPGAYWQDIGTIEGLKKARRYYRKNRHTWNR